MRSVTAVLATSREVSVPFRVLNESLYPAIGSRIPPRPSPRGGPRGFPRSRPRRSAIMKSDAILSWVSVPLQSLAVLAADTVSGDRHSRGVRSLSALEDIGSPLHPGLPHPVRSASRVSHPPDGFLLPIPPGLVSCRWRS
jgi:hypothetical protein